MVSFVLACTALALDMSIASVEEPALEALKEARTKSIYPSFKLPSEMKETDWVHFGNKMRLKLSGSKNLYLHADANGWLYIKPGSAGSQTEFEALSILPSNPGAHGRLSFGQKFYLKAVGASFVHLGNPADVRQGDNFFVSDSMKRTVFHMIDW